MEIVEFKGWTRNLRLANKGLELIATLDVGPRIMHLAVPGKKNVFKAFADQIGGAREKKWLVRGGHRLWMAPEHPVKTYHPDNDPVVLEGLPKGGVRLRPSAEKSNGLQKEIDLFLDDARPHVHLVHRLKNVGRKPLFIAPWALSVMDAGGTAIVPLPPRGSHPKDLLPNQLIVCWPYTDLGDKRLTFGTECILLSQDRKAKKPEKFGMLNPEGWAAYSVHGCLFVKRFACGDWTTYPDMGCNTEFFTNADMLEVESLGAMVELKAGKSVEHVEDWFLFGGVPAIRSEADVDRYVRPLLRKTV